MPAAPLAGTWAGRVPAHGADAPDATTDAAPEAAPDATTEPATDAPDDDLQRIAGITPKVAAASKESKACRSQNSSASIRWLRSTLPF